MAKSATGRSISRIGAQGGSKAYRRARPLNFYGIVTVIVILGVALVTYTRYNYQHPHKATSASAGAPKVGSTLYAAFGIEACGQRLPYLAETQSGVGLLLGEKDVIKVSPISNAESGSNANLSTFASEYTGLVLTSNEIAVPTAKGKPDPKTTYRNGDVCATGTPDAGKKGEVVYAYWSSFSQKKPTLTTNPADVHFTKDIQVVAAFLPKGATPKVPATATLDAMVGFATETTSTSTTAPSTTLTTTSTLTTTTTTTTTSTTTPSSTTSTTSGG